MTKLKIVRNDLGTKRPGYEMTGNEVCVPSFSRGAICVILDDQENIIYSLPSHIATSGAIFEGRIA